MSRLTAEMNERSIETIRKQISKKTSDRPYFSSGNIVSNVVTDMDHQPYSRWFRGVYNYPDPVIMEREAGFRQIEDQCYTVSVPPHAPEEHHLCFEPACSTVFPCNPEKYDNRSNMDRFNKLCIVQYR